MVVSDSNRLTFLLANQLTLYTVFGLICYSLYYIHIIHTIRLEGYSKTSALSDIEAETLEVEEDENKYDELYKNIIACTERGKGYLDPDFSISALAFALNSNIAYISMAIRKKRDMNFCTFVNTYRIEHAKRMLHQGSEKYTIRHLCFSSGFHNQTTFNKAFKACEGVTPMEYMKLHQKADEDDL
jgi:YesN/AraC family two-component response regulator